MTEDINEFYATSVKNNMCTRYLSEWNKSDKQHMAKVALSVQGISWIIESQSSGWGISPSWLIDNLGEYLNGNHVNKENGLTSEMYVKMNDNSINATSDLYAFVDCRNTEIKVSSKYAVSVVVGGESLLYVNIGDDKTVFLDVYGNAKVHIIGSGINSKAKIKTFGSNASVVIDDHSKAKINIKNINKWDV